MRDPENNEVTTTALTKVLPMYTDVDCFVLDRVCKYVGHAQRLSELRQIKYFAVDRFHARLHGPNCKCSPLNVPRLDRRLKDLNTSVCEQTFSWFRRYAKVANEMREFRNKFFVLYAVRQHNQETMAGTTSYLNAYSANKKTNIKKGTPYSCSKKSSRAQKQATARTCKKGSRARGTQAVQQSRAMKVAKRILKHTKRVGSGVHRK